MCKTEADNVIPLPVKFWVYLYNLRPKLPSPLNAIPFSIYGALFLLVWRLFLLRLLIHLGWPGMEKATWFCAENIPAIIHSSNLCPILFLLLRSQPYNPASKMSSHPQWWQDASNAMMEFCIGYMIYDGCSSLIYRNYVFTPGLFSLKIGADLPFLGHHIATVLYMYSCRRIQAGQMSTMIAMFLGEFTNPFQNCMLCMKEAMTLGDCCAGDLIKFYYPRARFVFGLLYASIRIVIAPLFFAHISYKLLLTKEGRANVNIKLGGMWVFLLWAVTVGAIPWMIESVEIVRNAVFDADGNLGLSFDHEEL